jgi:hypothetical protein
MRLRIIVAGAAIVPKVVPINGPRSVMLVPERITPGGTGPVAPEGVA